MSNYDNFYVESVCKDVRINEYGDAHINLSYKNVKIKEKSVKSKVFPFEATTDIGMVRKIQVNAEKLIMHFIESTRAENRIKGFFELDREIDSNFGSFPFEVSYRLLNGFAMNEEQYQKMFGKKQTASEYAILNIPRQYGQINCSVLFPSGFKPEFIGVSVISISTGEINHLETNFQNKNLVYSKTLVALSSGDLTKALQFIVVRHQNHCSNRQAESW